MFQVWKLDRKIQNIQRAYAKDRGALEKKKAPRDEIAQLEASEYVEVGRVEREIEIIVGNRLYREARSLDVDTPPLSEKEMWSQEEYGDRVWFTPKGRAHVRKLIHEERNRRFEESSRGFTRIILPLLTLSLGIIGTITGLVALNLNRKQMEGVRAAVIELPRGIAVDFPVPPNGEVRANITNSGQVIAHDVHLALSLNLKDKGPAASERNIFSRDETVPAIPPTPVATRPDLFHPFELSPEEHSRLMQSDSYLVAEGSLVYENGFGTKVRLPFCYAYVWGSNKFGRWTGTCEDVQSELRSAKKMASSKSP